MTAPWRLWFRKKTRDLFLDVFNFTICATPLKENILPENGIFVANHTSHLDALVLLAALSPKERDKTRPVAALDYWNKSLLHRYIAKSILNAVLIDRKVGGFESLEEAKQALSEGKNLIIFPEGTRSEEPLPHPFKGGFAELALNTKKPIIPVYLTNLSRIMPKGAPLPLPLTCQARFGTPIIVTEEDNRKTLSSKAHAAVCGLFEQKETV